MTLKNEELSWLDLVLYFGWQMASEQYPPDHIPHSEKRRIKRIESVLTFVPENEELWQRCKQASTVIATWFAYLPTSRQKYFNPELLEAINRFDFMDSDKVKDPSTVLNDFTARHKIQLKYHRDFSGKGITLHPLSNGDFMVVLIWRPWFEFAAEKKSRPVYMCGWCGVPFHPARSDARYHNQNCRSAARRAQIQDKPE